MATIAELLVKIGIDSSKIGSGMDKVVQGISKAEGKISGAGLLAGGALMAGFLEGMEVEKAGDKLAAQLALTEDESARVGAVAGDLYANAYGGSIDEVNTALSGIISRTEDLGEVSDSELSKMGAAALDYAATFDQDVAKVTQVAGQMVSEGLATDFTHAFDIMSAGSQQTAAGMQGDLLDASDEYGTFFQSLGFNGEEAFGLLATASEKGMFGIDKTGDAIKEFSILATEAGGTGAAAFEAMGMDADEMANSFLAGGDTAKAAFDKTIDGLLSMTDPAAQAQAAVDLFGTPIEDLNKAEIPEFLASLQSAESGLGNVEGASSDLGTTLNDNTATSFTTLARTAKMDLMEAIAPLIPKIQAFLDVIIPLTPHISTVVGVIIALVAIIKTVKAIIVAVTAVQWLWNIAMTANPIGLIIAGIVALIAIIVAVIMNWETVKQVTIDIWNAIVDFFVEYWPYLFAIMTGGLTIIIDFIIDHWDEIKEITSKVWNAIKDFFVNLWNSIVDFFKRKLEEQKMAFQIVWNAIKSVVESVWNKIKNSVSSAVNWVKDKITGAWNTVKTNTSNALNSAKNTVNSVWTAIQNKVSGAVNKIKGFFSGMWDGIKNGLKSALNGAISLINGAIGGINELIRGANKVPGVSIPTIPNIPYLADGGNITGSGWAMVGEAGPELLRMPRGAQVQPLDRDNGGGNGGDREVRFVFEGDEDMIRMFRRAIRVRGGLNVVFGRQ
jgi:phage-related minor tail protein